MSDAAPSVHMWQNGMCITYLLRFRQMENYLKVNGWQVVDVAADADLLIIGACAAFLPYFQRYARYVSAIPDRAELVVYGCLPSVNRNFYRENTPKHANCIHSRHPRRLEKIVTSLQADPIIPWEKIPTPTAFRRTDYAEYTSRRRFVLVQEGCSEKCVYCPHRMGIGRERSRQAAEIVEEVQRSVDQGADWIVLEGNNSGSWGLDLEPEQTFPDLLAAIWKLEGQFEVHIGDFSPRWVREYGDALRHPRITDIKIPIQTTSPRLLQLMGRDPYGVEMSALLKALRRRRPDMVLRTEIIIGFPSETQDELIHTLEFVAEHFTKVGCFSFDLHPFTEAARMGFEQLDDAEIARRILLAMDFFADKPTINASFDDRGRVMAKVTGCRENQ